MSERVFKQIIRVGRYKPEVVQTIGYRRPVKVVKAAEKAVVLSKVESNPLEVQASRKLSHHIAVRVKVTSKAQAERLLFK